MVAALSEGRPKYAEHADVLASAGAAGRQLAKRFLDLADEDAAAYAEFSKALKLPKETGAQKASRTTAMRSAARVAAEVPMRCVESCRELVRATESLAGRSNVNASSDLNVAALLGEAAARGAAANVLVNLPSVGDDVWAAESTERVDGLLHDIASLAEQTRQVVASGEARPPVEAELEPSGAPRP
jgi:formiminotetrahydrofolate cyclodeaminase